MIFLLSSSAEHLHRSFVKYGCDTGRYESYVFADGERGYRLKVNVKGKSVAVVASILPRPESLFELMVLNHLVCENGARETTLVIPYLGYARQDRPSRKGEGSIGLMVARFILHVKPSRLILLDVHSNLIRKAFGRSGIEISALSLFTRALARRPPEVIIAPDAGSVSRAERLANLFDPRPDVASIDKVRPRANVAVAKRLRGDVRGKSALILDDIIDTGGTLAEAVKWVSRNGSLSVRSAATHGIFSGDARDRLSHLPIEEMLVTNTLPQIRHPKIRVLDIVPLILKKLKDGGPL
jgi:ribose-phosphate pyrophosphokinase